MAHRVSRQAEADLTDIWCHAAKESGSVEIADRLIESITRRFLLISLYPHLGRRREDVFGQGVRTFPVDEYVIVYAVDESDVLVLRVVHGRRDIEALFGL
ncbi:MAG TPA: type II toxin-antitoxin system RelE/ParE family toxin [Candidatus Acidoferrales bacterium]|nr:type II toxin-antitoxin system RelE/ParE family toxin [Candidatus Acidoferrales bacterium]